MRARLLEAIGREYLEQQAGAGDRLGGGGRRGERVVRTLMQAESGVRRARAGSAPGGGGGREGRVGRRHLVVCQRERRLLGPARPAGHAVGAAVAAEGGLGALLRRAELVADTSSVEPDSAVVALDHEGLPVPRAAADAVALGPSSGGEELALAGPEVRGAPVVPACVCTCGAARMQMPG